MGIAAWGSNGQGQRWRISQTVGTGTVTSDQFFDAPIILPTGALLTGVRFDYCDTNATVDVAGAVQSAPEPAGGVDQYGAFGSSGTPGCTSSLVDLSSAPPQINNSTASFWARFSLGAATDSSTQLRGATVFYKLQVSPAPAVATFTDVPTSHPFFQYIEALASSGITGGCVASPPQYCPDAPVTRGQMAVFISRALGLHWPN